jgi:hypothetical protein
MHDRLDHHRMNEEASLAAALRALPGTTPVPDAWPALAARIQRRRATRRNIRVAIPVALAAGIALAFVLPRARQHTPVPARVAQSVPVAAAPAVPDLAALQTSSRQWQAWVQTLDRNGAPLDGQRLARAVALQDRIGLVDLQLSAAHNTATLAGLWQQRITLLQQLGLLHLQPYLAVTRPSSANPPLISM